MAASAITIRMDERVVQHFGGLECYINAVRCHCNYFTNSSFSESCENNGMPHATGYYHARESMISHDFM